MTTFASLTVVTVLGVLTGFIVTVEIVDWLACRRVVAEAEQLLAPV